MLVLSRKKGESIVIDDHIEIKVIAVEGDTVKLGISAPADVDIFRKEIYLAIQEANKQSAAPAKDQIQAFMSQYQQSMKEKK